MHPAHPETSSENHDIFCAVDLIAERIRKHACEPKCSSDLRKRSTTEPDYNLPDTHVLETMIRLIAYSEAVQAIRIEDLERRGVLDRVFAPYSPDEIAKLEPDELKEKYWNNPDRPNERLSPLRFPKKLKGMVECARGLRKHAQHHGSFMRFLAAQGFPQRIRSHSDLDAFWRAFDLTRSQVDAAFFTNFTSLCHLLQTLGFDCAKPDSVVMNVAVCLGIVKRSKNAPERDRRRVVQTMQLYSASRGIPTPVVDLYFLIHGRQTGAVNCVLPSYYSSSG